jgi:hypothetical protein
MERVAAVTRAQVSMNMDTPWTQNAAGAQAQGSAEGGVDGVHVVDDADRVSGARVR